MIFKLYFSFAILIASFFNLALSLSLSNQPQLRKVFNHTPYDARHTFITNMKRAEANEYLIKLIVGHSIKDITEGTYTHREIKELVDAVNMIDSKTTRQKKKELER